MGLADKLQHASSSLTSQSSPRGYHAQAHPPYPYPPYPGYAPMPPPPYGAPAAPFPGSPREVHVYPAQPPYPHPVPYPPAGYPQGFYPPPPPAGYPPVGYPPGNIVDCGNDYPPGHFGDSDTRNPDSIYRTLKACVDENRLHYFYPDAAVHSLAERCSHLAPQVEVLARSWKLTPQITADLYKLALYDVILLCDDSGSMQFQERGSRIDDLKVVVGYAAQVASIFDTDGIDVRFLNSAVQGDGIVNVATANTLIKQVKFAGPTPLGTSLERKVLRPFFYEKIKRNALQKPLLVICITDGRPAGEPENALFTTILDVIKYREHYGNAVAFSFAQVGNDKAAQEFLSELDRHPNVGDALDVTSNYEMEEEEMRRSKGVELTPELWIAKLMLGAIDATYDALDE